MRAIPLVMIAVAVSACCTTPGTETKQDVLKGRVASLLQAVKPLPASISDIQYYESLGISSLYFARFTIREKEFDKIASMWLQEARAHSENPELWKTLAGEYTPEAVRPWWPSDTTGHRISAVKASINLNGASNLCYFHDVYSVIEAKAPDSLVVYLRVGISDFVTVKRIDGGRL